MSPPRPPKIRRPLVGRVRYHIQGGRPGVAAGGLEKLGWFSFVLFNEHARGAQPGELGDMHGKHSAQKLTQTMRSQTNKQADKQRDEANRESALTPASTSAGLRCSVCAYTSQDNFKQQQDREQRSNELCHVCECILLLLLLAVQQPPFAVMEDEHSTERAHEPKQTTALQLARG